MRAALAFVLAAASCPAATPGTDCGACPSHLEAASSKGVSVIGGQNFRCTQAGMATLSTAGCPNCAQVLEYDVPFDYSSCGGDNSEACEAWRWLKCAFPDDDDMHAYFFLDAVFLGTGFQVQRLGVEAVRQQLVAAEVSVSDDPCADAYPDAHNVVETELKIADANGVVLFGWDGCPCTAIAQGRFRSKDACYQQLTWSNPQADIMSYLQCKEADTSHHSFIYTKKDGQWTFRGNGFQFDAGAMSNSLFTQILDEANYQSGCQDVFAVNLYGEALSECRASASDARGSWMWDGKCTEEGGGVHQICMDRLPADFSVTTGQGPWSESRLDQRHCVCVGAWSLYMTREADPDWATTASWPFCSAIPASALTSRYVNKWKDWNGIPANIVFGVKRLVQKCYELTQGPGSTAPSAVMKCRLLKAFRELQTQDEGLTGIDEEQVTGGEELDCDAVMAEAEVAEETPRSESVADAGDRVNQLSGQEPEQSQAPTVSGAWLAAGAGFIFM